MTTTGAATGAATGKVPVLCAGCRHTEAQHIYQGPDLPRPCMNWNPRTAVGWCPCHNFEREGLSDARP